MHTLKQGLFSSVGRASDWRSEGPWFNPRWRHFSFFPSTLITIFKVCCATTLEKCAVLLHPNFLDENFLVCRAHRTPPIVGAQNRPSVVGAQLTVCCAKFQHMASGNKNLKKILAENYFLACNQVELRRYVTCQSVSCSHWSKFVRDGKDWKGSTCGNVKEFPPISTCASGNKNWSLRDLILVPFFTKSKKIGRVAQPQTLALWHVFADVRSPQKKWTTQGQKTNTQKEVYTYPGLNRRPPRC